MKRCSKVLAMLLSVVLLTFAAGTGAEAAETTAPFTADQLMAVVNAQCAGISSLREVIAESVQMTEKTTGLTMTVNLTADLKQSRAASHLLMAMNLSLAGYSQTVGQESYSMLNGNYLDTYTLDSDTGEWEKESRALSPAGLAAFTQPFTLDGMDTTGSVVTTDGLVYRFTAAVDSASMTEYTDMLLEAGVKVGQTAFPVTMEIDAQTLLPKSMVVTMTDLTMDGAPGTVVNVTAIATFDSFNQFDTLSVPAEVIASAS